MREAAPILVATFFIVVFAFASIVFYDSHKTRVKKLRLGRFVTTKNLSRLLFLLFILLLISAVGLVSINN